MAYADEPAAVSGLGGAESRLHLCHCVPLAQGWEAFKEPRHVAPVFSEFWHSRNSERTGHLFCISEEMGSYPAKEISCLTSGE